MALADFASGVQDALRQMVADRIAAEELKRKRKMEEDRLGLEQAQHAFARERAGIEDVRAERAYQQTATQQALQGAHLRAQIGELQRAPQKEEAAHQHALALEDVRQAGALRVARARTSTQRPRIQRFPTINAQGKMVTQLRDIDSGEVLEEIPSVPPTAEREAGRASDRTLDYLETVATTFKPEFVGPGAARIRQLGQAIPGISDNPAFGALSADVEALTNEMTRLLFSSRASDQDVKRVMAQVPVMTDKPGTFLAKLRQSAVNARALREKLSTLGVP